MSLYYMLGNLQSDPSLIGRLEIIIVFPFSEFTPLTAYAETGFYHPSSINMRL